MATIPEFMNGQLMPAIYDDVFKHVANYDPVEWVGNDQGIGWTVTPVTLDRDDIASIATMVGNPRATEAGAIEPGRYLIRENSDGIVWAYFYPNADDSDFKNDYAEACELDNVFGRDE